MKRLAFMLILAITWQLFIPGPAVACGPFSLDTIFTFTVHPEYPLENYARGNLGIVQPTYARSYLYVAYQYFNGNSFNASEQAALVDLWRDRLDLRWEPQEEGSIKRWLTVRKTVRGVSEINAIEVYRNREEPNSYESYLNCQKDAFETAANTLEDRSKKWGVDSPLVKSWVDAQDTVFANCSQGDRIPTAPVADSDALVRADRQYQIAAANFYAAKFDEALAAFEAIEKDRTSPWRAAATYLLARTYLRKASLGKEDQKVASLTQAEKQLQAILKNNELKSLHASAARLLNLTRLRLHPLDTIHDLSASLTRKNAHPTLKQDLWDYTVLLDQYSDVDTTKVAPGKIADIAADDLTDWLVNFQDESPEATIHSVDRWKATRALPWLIAALSKIEAGNADAAALKQAAAAIPKNSPAFASAMFYLIRLETAANDAAEARAKLDQLLREDRSRFNASSLNLLRGQRMLVANSLDDFLTYAQRVPAGLSWNDDGREIPAEESEYSEEMKPLLGKPLFDDDAARILNQKLPLSILKQAATNKNLPEHLRRDIAQASWLRAILLNDMSTANELVPTLKALVPDLAPFLDKFVASQDPGAKKFAAMYAWLKFPGLEPVVDTGIGRTEPLKDQDTYRDNWWCSAAIATDQPETTKKAAVVPSPAFLTASERAAAAKEYATLSSFGAAPNYIARQVIDWATKNSADPRVPEALHLAVKATRYGCTDKQTGRWSKAAYDILHRRFPNNSWTKQTPYWFKD